MRAPLLTCLLAACSAAAPTTDDVVGGVDRGDTETDAPDADTDAPDADLEGLHGALPTATCRDEVPASAEGDCLRTFTLPDATGALHPLGAQAGKVLVVDFSAYWCSTCRRLAPHGQELLDRHGTDDLHVVTVIYESADGLAPVADAELEDWADAFGLTHPVLADRDSSVRDRFGGRERPLVLVVGRDGRIASRTGSVVEVIDATVQAEIAR
ncbi:MAG: TlpA family protein disulfide reductase [Alphaproteobacteria bacterium]|nr:TlpA family protein disulfide reductase [Alphaproteobacteria bacterium]